MLLLPRNLVPASWKDWIRRILYGPVLAEDMAQAQGDVMEAQARLYRRGAELLRETREARASDDDLEREWALLYAEALKETAQLGRALNGDMTADERSDLLSRPFAGSSSEQPSLPDDSWDDEEDRAPKAPEDGPPARRGPGRPKGSKNRKSEEAKP
jgi:hypothetical protein